MKNKGIRLSRQLSFKQYVDKLSIKINSNIFTDIFNIFKTFKRFNLKKVLRNLKLKMQTSFFNQGKSLGFLKRIARLWESSTELYFKLNVCPDVNNYKIFIVIFNGVWWFYPVTHKKGVCPLFYLRIAIKRVFKQKTNHPKKRGAQIPNVSRESRAITAPKSKQTTTKENE